MWSKFLSGMKKRDNLIMGAFSFFLALNSLFFIALVVEQVGIFAVLELKKIYVLYFILLGAYLVWGFLKVVPKGGFESFLRKSFFVFFPPVAVLLYGFSESIKFNVLFKLGVGFYFLVLGFYLIYRLKGYGKVSDFWKSTEKEKYDSRKSRLLLLGVAILVLLNLTFGIYHLSRFAAVDEALWTSGRITKYWNNIAEGEWEKTMVSDKPGITVAILGGPGLLFLDPGDYDRKKDYGRDFDPPLDVRDMNFIFRLPILLVGGIGIFLFFFFLRRLIGEEAAFLAVIFIGLSPLLLGISTIINPDSLLWILAPLSLLAYLNYLKSQSPHWLLVSGGILGLALLTKYVANILYVLFFAVLFLEYIFHREKYSAVGAGKYLRRALLDYSILIFLSLAVFYLLLPKAWVEIEALLSGTILSQAFQKVWPIFLGIIFLIAGDVFYLKGRVSGFILDRSASLKNWIAGILILSFTFLAFSALLNTILGMRWFDLEAILASPKSAYMTSGVFGMMLANFYSLVFGVSPWVLLGMGIFLLMSLGKKEKSETFFTGLILTVFILAYYMASSINNVSATVRYQIIIYPLAGILGALGIGNLFRYFQKKKAAFWIASAILIFSGIYSLNFIRPFYFSYANSLLPEKYILNMKDMGDGSYEAAQYLNSLPHPEDIEIWTDKRGVCMFFLGRCLSGIGYENEEAETFDYFVVSSGRESRTTNMTLARYEGGNRKILRLDQLYLEENPEWELTIGGRENNFVKVIRNR